MSQPRLIYPLLDGFLLGDAISEHDGVRCYPAIRQITGEKYIVKVISVPASRVQLDALLLTGAFSGKDAALAYFKDLAKDLAKDAQTLLHLSYQEGFVAYQDSQIISAADGNGYEVYLLGTFKHTLEREFAANTMTHRSVVELGLDLCAALAACRRAGYLYVDLKPSNVFCSDEHGCRIGDVGFVSLSSLQFTPLQNQYRSRYTAPEMADDFAVINQTLDVYALGLVLYQACNGGTLPENGDVTVPPLYADYELAEIIRKACAPAPADRWQDPTQMAQALIGYMQQNEVTDDPMIPVPMQEEPVETEEFLPEASEEELAQEMAQLPQDELLLQALTADATAPELADMDVPEDISDMLAQADDLIAHELPEPPVAPEPIAVPMPEPILPEPEPEPEPEPKPEPEPEPAPEPELEPVPQDAVPDVDAAEAEPEEADEPSPRKPFPWRPVLAIALIALLLFSGILAKRYYDGVYVQNIEDLVITHTDDTATVKVLSSIDESLLTVVCSDSYGNTQQSAVTAGIAMFSGLQPQTRYTVRVEIAGNHKLTGVTTGTFTTPAQTQVLTFTACMGSQDASVLLTLTSSGPAVESWLVAYSADGVESLSTTFSGNSVTITDLQVGKEYTFTLSAEGQSLGGVTQTSFTASDIIVAQELAITACGGGSLTVQWNAPENTIVTGGWAVHCYDGAGFDETIVTYEPWYTFTGMDHSTACTVEVTAVGMYQSVSTTIAANPVTIEGCVFSVSAADGLTISWTFSGNAPEGGWILDYTIDGVAYTALAAEAIASVQAIPGSHYTFSIRAASDTAVFGGSATYELTEVGAFSGYGISADSLTAVLELPQLKLTADAETVIETSEDAIEILFILRTGDGSLLDTSTINAVWKDLWLDNVCSLTMPAVPEAAGTYRLSVYFAGGLVTEQEFTIA